MTDAVTTNSDLYFNPVVVGDLAVTSAFQRSPLLGSRAVRNVSNMAQVNPGGTTVTFPKFTTDLTNTIVQASPETRTGVDSSKVTMDSTTATIYEKIISIQGTKRALRTAQGINAHIADIVSSELRRTLHAALITAATATSKTYTAAGTITIADIVKAIATNWGEEADYLDPVLAVPSKVWADLMVLTGVLDASQFGGGDSVAVSGKLQQLIGMPVIKVDGVQYNSGSSALYDCLILGSGALDLFIAQDLEAEEKANSGTTVRTHDFDFAYAVHLNESYPGRAIRFRCASSIA